MCRTKAAFPPRNSRRTIARIVGAWQLRNSSGVTGAAPIFNSVMLAAMKRARGAIPIGDDDPIVAPPERRRACSDLRSVGIEAVDILSGSAERVVVEVRARAVLLVASRCAHGLAGGVSGVGEGQGASQEGDGAASHLSAARSDLPHRSHSAQLIADVEAQSDIQRQLARRREARRIGMAAHPRRAHDCGSGSARPSRRSHDLREVTL
jgi:hypothetical protein